MCTAASWTAPGTELTRKLDSRFSLVTRCSVAPVPVADWSLHLPIKLISLDNTARLGAAETVSSMSPDGEKEDSTVKSAASAPPKISNKVSHALKFHGFHMPILCGGKFGFIA